jgi:S-DNA-T family DNA segregation ATPase FtsK/SpoIIIE
MEQINNFNAILNSFKIKASCVNFKKINNCSIYDLKLEPQTKIKNLEKYAQEFSLALKEKTIPKFNVILDEGIVRMEFLSSSSDSINLFKLMENSESPSDQQIPILLGLDSYGNKVWMNLANNPHLLIAGCTGSGKSVALHNIIANLLSIKNINLFLIDPKNIEFSEYENMKNVHVCYTYSSAVTVLQKLESIMQSRFELIKIMKTNQCLQPIVVVIDEYADLSLQDMDNSLYLSLCKLAQKCRAAKIHFILATQRPSAKLIDGNIKANFPARLSCKVSSKIDSKIILDSPGAEELSGRGEAIINNYDHHYRKIKIAYTSSKEVKEKFAHGN